MKPGILHLYCGFVHLPQPLSKFSIGTPCGVFELHSFFHCELQLILQRKEDYLLFCLLLNVDHEVGR